MERKPDFINLLLGKDLRSITRANEVASMVYTQECFDQLFLLLFHHERTLVMRAADAIEKVTRRYPEYLQPHKPQLMSLFKSVMSIELKWHVAQLIPRLTLNQPELDLVVTALVYWARNPNESRIVRVNSIQAVHDLSQKYPKLVTTFRKLVSELEHDAAPSVNARIRKLINARGRKLTI